MKTAQERWRKHCEHAMGKRSAGALYSALRKYGTNSFRLHVIIESDDWNTLCTLEKDLIKQYNTLVPNGYNVSEGGEGVQGKRSAEDRRKISIAQKKRFMRPEERERMRHISALARLSPKWFASCIKKRKPKVPPVSKSEWHRRLMESLNDPAVRRKTSEAAKNRWKAEGFRDKYRAIRSGRKMGPCTEERKWKIAAARRREWQDPIIRPRRLRALAIARAAKKANEIKAH